MKIISFSLWGDKPKYCVGAVKNFKLAREIFPDWVCRFYIHRSVPHETIHELLRIGTDATMEIVPISVAPADWRGMFWRFDAASDPDCEAMISRDCDSRLSIREKLAVDEWMASDKQWHIMRDHPWHGALMLGGMWGVKGCPAMHDWIASWEKEDRYQTDQDFLRTIVYPIASKDAMIHAQFCAVEADAIPFPRPRSGLEFVGQVFDENDITVAEHQNMLMKALKMQGEPIRRENLPDCLK